MARTIDRDELTIMIEELDRGEAPRHQLEEMIEAIELSMPDDEALEVLEDDELTAQEIADQLVGYSDRDA